MAVLADQDIARELAYEDLDVSPVDLDEQLQPNSLDIRLGEDISVIDPKNDFIDPRKPLEEQVFEMKPSGDSFKVYPDDFVLADTVESFDIPDYLYAELNGRSSLARLGIEIHSVGGVIDSGFSGDIVLEISNNMNCPVKLYPGMRVAQVIFYELESKCNTPYSSKNNKYQGQEGVVNSRIHEDFE